MHGQQNIKIYLSSLSITWKLFVITPDTWFIKICMNFLKALACGMTFVDPVTDKDQELY